MTHPHRFRRCARPVTALAAAAAAAVALAACAANPPYTDNGTITSYTVPTAIPDLQGITLGPDGNLWFAEAIGKIGRVTPGGTVTEFALPAGSSPVGIVSGPGNQLWFADWSGNHIGTITTAGVTTLHSIPTASSGPYGITVGPDNRVWFAESNNSSVAVIDPTTFVVTEYATTQVNSRPQGIVTGPDGKLWFTEDAGAAVGSISTAGTLGTEVPLTAASRPLGITTGPDGNLWAAERGTAAGTAGIARVVPSTGTVTEFAVPGGVSGTDSVPVDIVAGPDGNLWYTQAGGNVGRVTTAGVVTQFPIPASLAPTGIARGPGNSLWFAANQNSPTQVGKVSTFDPVPLVGAVSPSSGPAAGGNEVVLACTGCLGTTTVAFGGTSLTVHPCPAAGTSCFTLDADGMHIRLPAPAGTAGTSVNVTITTPYATSPAATYRYATPGTGPPVPDVGGAAG
jgi:streptogramin lyase